MPDDPKPLSPEEVDALEHRFSDIASPNLLVLWRDEIASLFATVRDRERQRDQLMNATTALKRFRELLRKETERDELQRRCLDGGG